MIGYIVPSLAPLFNFRGRALGEMFLTAPVLFWAGREFFVGAWKAARHRAADMNTLIAVGTFSAFAYSVVATVAPHLLMTSSTRSMSGMEMSANVYYEIAAIVVTLIRWETSCKRAPTAKPRAPSKP